MISAFGFFLFISTCADRVAELRSKLILAPEFTITSKALEKLDYNRLGETEGLKPQLWKQVPSKNRIKKILKHGLAVAEDFRVILKYLSKDGTITFINGTSDHDEYRNTRFHIQPATFRIKKKSRQYIVTAEDGAAEINQSPHFIRGLHRKWYSVISDLFEMNFTGSPGWSSGGGGTHLNIGSDLDRKSIFDQYPHLLLKLYKLVFIHPGILFHFDEFCENTSAVCPLRDQPADDLKKKFKKIENAIKANDSKSALDISVKYLIDQFAADKHSHFISLKAFNKALKNGKRLHRYIEIRFIRSINSYEELKALEYFWLHTFAYLIDHDLEESSLSFKSPNEISVQNLRDDFLNWLKVIELPKKYHSVLTSLGGAKVSDPLQYDGPNIPFDFYRVPAEEGEDGKIEIRSKTNAPFTINGRNPKNTYAYLKHNPISPVSYLIHARDSDEIYTVTLKQNPKEWPTIRSSYKDDDIEYLFPKNISDLLLLERIYFKKVFQKKYPHIDFQTMLEEAYEQSRIIKTRKPPYSHFSIFVFNTRTNSSTKVKAERVVEDTLASYQISEPLSKRLIKQLRAGKVRVDK